MRHSRFSILKPVETRCTGKNQAAPSKKVLKSSTRADHSSSHYRQSACLPSLARGQMRAEAGNSNSANNISRPISTVSYHFRPCFSLFLLLFLRLQTAVLHSGNRCATKWPFSRRCGRTLEERQMLLLPAQAAKGAAWTGHRASRENQK